MATITNGEMQTVATTKCIAFWVYTRATITFYVQQSCNLQGLVPKEEEFFNNSESTSTDSAARQIAATRLDVNFNVQARLEQKKEVRTLDPGIYGVASELSLRYEISEGEVDFREKEGKDPWPLPPPPPPNVAPIAFPKVDSPLWKRDYERVFLNVGDGLLPPWHTSAK